MNEETEDSFVHHDDFTLSSEWEKFIDKLEKILFKWKLHEIKPGPFLKKEDYVNGFWEVVTESVDFADFKFDFRKYCLKPRKDEGSDKCTPVSPVSDEEDSSDDSIRTLETLLDLNSSENCFIPPMEVGSPDMYCIVRWYGLREFLVLTPQPRHLISSESRLKILLSSVLIAVNNCSCPVPVFVQFHHPSNHYFVGVSEGSNGIRVDFEMTHLNSPPPGSHLSGLLDMFKYKIRDPTALKGRIKVSAQFTYKIKNQTYIRPPAMDLNLGESPVETHLFFLPFKTHLNSWEIHLMATWPLLPEDAVVDRVGSSTFHPLSAPLWSIRMPFLSFPHPVLQPGRFLSNLEKGEFPLLAQYLLRCISCTQTSREAVLDTPVMKLIGGAELDYGDLGLPPKAALDILTNSKVADLTKVVNKATKSRLQKIWQGGNGSQSAGSSQTKKPEIVEEGPISDDKLLPILHFLFPDADETHKYSYPSGLTEGAIDEEEASIPKKKRTKFKRDCPWLGKKLKVGALLRTVQDPKTCPADSLVWRMALALAYVYQKFGGAMAAAHLWYEVTQEARYRWDKLIPLPGLVPGEPDHKTSLLNQKFQMLNCCIERRKKEKEARELQSSNSSSINYDSENSEEEEEDDNFFDCPDVPQAGEGDDENKSGASQVHGPKLSIWNRPEGRLEKMEDVFILSTGEQLYVPMTQEVPPKTEDQIEEDAELMEMLGNDALGTELRASMMCASLLSDMESFKAANPSAELIDFIRWYSPRDWVEEGSLNEFGQKKGHLSERMLLPGNKWQEVWKAAKPVPARRQKRLFNEGCVAEKVLHFLEVLSVSKIFRYMMPVLFQAVLWKIGQEMHNLESSEERAENPDEGSEGHSDSEENSCDNNKNENEDIDTMVMKNFSGNAPEALLSEEIVFPESVPKALKKITSRIRNVSLNPMAADQAFFMELILELAKVESLVSMARGAQILFKIDKQKLIVKDYLLFLKSLICEEEAVVPGGHKSPVGELVWNFIQQERWMDGKLLDEHLNAEQKEYVLQVMATRPAPYSRPTPQRLTAIVREGEFRLAGAFSQDTNFF